MKFFKFFAVFLLLSAVACSPVYKTKYTMEQPADSMGRVCAANCRTAQANCNAHCSAQEQSCRALQDVKAEQRYDDYVREQRRQKKSIERSVSSFVSYGSCSSQKCQASCDNELRACHTSCGGNVYEEVYCAAFCD